MPRQLSCSFSKTSALLLFCILLLAGDVRSAGAEASLQLTAPQVGLVQDTATGRLGRYAGVPGAARFTAMASPPGSDAVLIPPRSGYLLIRSDGELQVMTEELSPIAGLGICADVIGFSPSGSSIFVYCRASRSAKTVTGLPGTPRVSSALTAQYLPESPLRQLAVSDDGAALAGVDETGAAWTLGPERLPERVGAHSAVSAIGFVSQKSSLLLFERGWNQLWTYTLGTGVGRLVAGAGEGLDGATMLAASSDGERLLLLNPSAGRLWQVHFTTGETTELATPAAPNLLSAMNPADTFLITFRRGEPAWLLEDGPDGPRFRVLPAAPSNEASE